jgi:O-antigen ligase
MEMTLGLVLGLLIRGRPRLQKYLVLLPIAALVWIALIVSNTRGGIFASLCELLFLGILIDPFSRLMRSADGEKEGRPFHKLARGLVTRVVTVAILMVVFVLGVSWVGGERVTTNMELVSTAYDQPPEVDPRQNTRRKQIWSATWKMFKAHPIAGTGLGAYWVAITKYHDASGQLTPQEAHNDYLELLASGGLLGFAIVIWFVVRVANHMRRVLRMNGRLSARALGALVGIFGVLTHSFVDFGLHITSNALILCALIVMTLQAPGFEVEREPHMVSTGA